MPRIDRFRALYVLKYLWENTDEDHPVGFIVAKCQKCKSVTPLNLAYFYTSRAYSRPPAFLPDIETKT